MIDHTLASNWFTAFAPNPIGAVAYGIKHLLWDTPADLASRCRPAATAIAPQATRVPGDFVPMTVMGPGVAGPRPAATLRCPETGRQHPVLPQALDEVVDVHWAAISASQHPGDKLGFFRDTPRSCGLQDAFLARVPQRAGAAGERPRMVCLLPPAVQNASLLNRGLVLAGSNEAAPAGVIQKDCPNTLYDPKSGFAAGITVHATRDERGAPIHEVLIAFAPTSGQGGLWGSVMQGARAFLNILGLLPPKNFAQAAKLTRMVKQHLATLNAQRAVGTPEYRLKLTGHSLGGGMATYAALLTDTPALVTAPLRLGMLARAKVGRQNLREAARLVTEVAIPGDWVASNPLARLYGWTGNSAGAIGRRYHVPRPTAEQLRGYSTAVSLHRLGVADPQYFHDFSTHNDLALARAIQRWERDERMLPTQVAASRQRAQEEGELAAEALEMARRMSTGKMGAAAQG